MTNPETAAVLDKIAATVAEHGHAVICTEREDGRPYSYTVGRSAAGRPELLVTGLPADVATTLLNVLAEADDQSPLSHGDLLVPGRVLSGFGATVIAADPAAAGLGIARRYAEVLESDLTAMQLLWPDAEGNLPGSDECSLSPDAQPVFALTDD